jgi:hypothetical protein
MQPSGANCKIASTKGHSVRTLRNLTVMMIVGRTFGLSHLIFYAGKRKITQEIETGFARRSRGRPRKTTAGSGSSTKEKTTIQKSVKDRYARPPSQQQICGFSESAVIRQALSKLRVDSGERQANKVTLCRFDAAETLKFIDQLAKQVYRAVAQGCPSADMLLSLTQFNVLRAMGQNMAFLDLSVETVKEDIISSFNQRNVDGADDEVFQTNLPPSLRPTQLQKNITHHPWLDPFPVPAFRDALLQNAGHFSETDLCKDLVGHCGQKDGSTHIGPGIVVWSEPWDPYGWELSESFAREWMWLIRGCTELLESTNYWRARRGEKRLFEL